jgi:asparagine synthase (glutamine-hydrolysing)
LQLERYWKWMPQYFLSMLARTSRYLNTNHSTQRRLVKFINGVNLENSERLMNYFRWTNNSVLNSLYSKEFKEGLEVCDPGLPMKDFISPISSNIPLLDKMLTLEQRFFLADHNLIYTDKMSMAASVEVRVPFLDTDLVEFAANIANKYKQRGNKGKWVLKKAMESYLPKDVIYRPKTGFGVPLRSWMKNDLRELLGDLLSVDSLNNRGLFSASAVQQLIMDNDNGKIDASYTLLSLLCIEIWCRAYIDN